MPADDGHRLRAARRDALRGNENLDHAGPADGGEGAFAPADDAHRAWSAMRDALRGSQTPHHGRLRVELMQRIATTRAATLGGVEAQARLLAELVRPEALADGDLERLLVLNIAASLAALLAAAGLG